MDHNELTRTPGLEFDADEQLFHYTSSTGLFGILQSGSLWATHYRFLNDSKEFVAAKASLTRYLASQVKALLARLKVNGILKLKEGVDKELICIEEAERFVSVLYGAILGTEDGKTQGVDGYIFSGFRASPSDGRLYTDGGLLHWATYGKNGGFALRLDPRKLENMLCEEGKRFNGLAWGLNRAVYGEENHVPDTLRDQYSTVGRAVQDMAEAELLGKRLADGKLAPLVVPLVQIISLLKDKYFESEKEARLIVFRGREVRSSNSRHELLIRHASGMPIPYIALFRDLLLGENCPIEGIIVGPHPDNARRIIALQKFLEAKGITSIEVTTSNVPYAPAGT